MALSPITPGMFDLAPDPALGKPALYAAVADAAVAVTAGEADKVANMANIAALIWHFLPDLNWAGFYRAAGNELVLGPFQGKPACIRIPFGSGVCGAAAAQGKTQLVADVRRFPGHIACDAASRSELVVPVLREGRLVAVIDLDSPLLARFDEADAAGLERLAARIAPAI